MYNSYAEIVEKLNWIRDTISSNPERISNNFGPIIFGVIGMGIVGQGAVDILQELGAENIPIESLEDIQNLDKEKIYYVTFGRKHFLQKNNGEDFSHEDYLANKGEYKTIFCEKYLSKLSVLLITMAWNPEYPQLITTEEINTVLENEENRLMAIGDICCMANGPVEFFTEETTSENPFFYYDPTNGVTQGPEKAGENSLIYLACEKLPSELPKESSKMFEHGLKKYLTEISEKGGATYDTMNDELKTGCIIFDGKITDPYSYLR